MNKDGKALPGTSPEEIARQAIEGDRDSLEQLVRILQGDIYGLALRMLGNQEDAEDATQEILVRIVTRLAKFDFRSRLKTWAYRVAANYILDMRKNAVERLHLNFAHFADELMENLSLDAPSEIEESLLIEEVKTGCSLGMLQCLDRPHRLAYILGEIMDFTGPEAAEALDISPSLFRKRLQHARTAILTFTRTYCGLASDNAPCSCNRQVPAALRTGKVNPDSLDSHTTAASYQQTRAMVRQTDEARWALEVHRSSHPRASSIDFARRLVEVIEARQDPEPGS